MRKNETLLDTLLELEGLDRVPRTGWFLRGVADCESVAEHTFHVVFLVWAAGSRVSGLDLGRATQLALLHDLGEMRTGDLPRTAQAYLAREEKVKAERRALDDVLAPLAGRAAALANEYQAQETLEARFVKACDRLQLLLKAARYEAHGARGLEEFWESDFDDLGFPVLAELAAELAARRSVRSP